MARHRSADDITERWLSRELRARIARIGVGLAREADTGRDQADREPQVEREAEQ
jgi:hypothetical protein